MNKINKITILLIAIFTALMLAGCKNPVNSDNDDNNNNENSKTGESINAGWYVYTTNADSEHSQSTYLYINISGAIERAGSSSNEYAGTQLELIQGQLSYSICKKNADGINITFETTEAPSWSTQVIDDFNTDNPDDNPEDENGDNEETTSQTQNLLIIGLWYCPGAGLFQYLEFYNDGTGKAYISSDNYSSFSWSINGFEITLTGNLSNTDSRYGSKNFTVSTDTLWFEKLCGLSDLTFTRQ